MRVAHVVASYAPRIGGVETHVKRIAEACASAGDEVTVLTHATGSAPAREDTGGVRVLRFPETVRSVRYPLSLRLSRYLAEHAGDFDVVHAHSYHTLVGHAAVRSGLPFVFTPHYHGTGHTRLAVLMHRAYRPAGAWVMANADAVICVSQAERDLMIGDFLTVARKTHVIPNGTDPRAGLALPDGDRSVPAPGQGQRQGLIPRQPVFVDPVPGHAVPGQAIPAHAVSGHAVPGHSVPRQRAAPPGTPTVLTVGRLERYKNVDLVIRAFGSLRADADLVIVGDGPDRARLEQLARGAGRVRFAGRVSDAELDELLAAAAVVTSASDHEAFGLVVADGLTAGARVVASEIPAHREIGRLAGDAAPITYVNPRDTGAFTAALGAALASGKASGARAWLPTWADVADQTREVYAAVVSRGTGVLRDFAGCAPDGKNRHGTGHASGPSPEGHPLYPSAERQSLYPPMSVLARETAPSGGAAGVAVPTDPATSGLARPVGKGAVVLGGIAEAEGHDPAQEAGAGGRESATAGDGESV